MDAGSLFKHIDMLNADTKAHYTMKDWKSRFQEVKVIIERLLNYNNYNMEDDGKGIERQWIIQELKIMMEIVKTAFLKALEIYIRLGSGRPSAGRA